jgi:hypothetical protein
MTARRDFQRAQLIADGRKAIAMVKHGASINDVLASIQGSRARLYRAIRIAMQQQPIDPLLL